MYKREFSSTLTSFLINIAGLPLPSLTTPRKPQRSGPLCVSVGVRDLTPFLIFRKTIRLPKSISTKQKKKLEVHFKDHNAKYF